MKRQAPRPADNPEDREPDVVPQQTKKDTGNDPREGRSLAEFLTGRRTAAEDSSSDERAGGSDEPAEDSSEPTQDASDADTASSDSEPDTQTPEAKDAPQTQQGSEEGEEGDVEKLLPGKFKEDPERFVNSYNEIQKKVSEQGTQLSQQNQKLEELNKRNRRLETYLRSRQQLQQQQQGQQQPSQQQTQQQPAESEQKDTSGKSDIWRDPDAHIEKTAREILQEELEPLKREWNAKRVEDRNRRQIREAAEKYPDFEDMAQEVKQVAVREGKALLSHENPWEAAYKLAKADQAINSQASAQADTAATSGQSSSQPTQQNADTSQQSSDEQGLNLTEEQIQQLVEDPDVKQRLLEQLSLQQNEQQAPQVIGDQPSQAPASPPADIKSIDDAAKATSSWLNNLINKRQPE